MSKDKYSQEAMELAYAWESTGYPLDAIAESLLKYQAELAELKVQLKAADEGLLSCFDPNDGWQGIKSECLGWNTRAKKAEAELAELRSKLNWYFECQ
jgi:hypothetical protein